MSFFRGIEFLFKVLLIFIPLIFLSCSNQIEQQKFKKNMLVFGTVVDITFSQASFEQSQKIFHEIENYFNKMHIKWHAWSGDGLLMQINNNIALNQVTQIDSETALLIKLSKEVYSASEGRFDPGIGKIISIWGFHKKPKKWQLPPKKELDSIINQNPSIANINIDNNQLLSNNKHVKIDLGGIAKGYLLKKAISIIKRNGVKNAIVNAGGDICVLGSAHNRAWNIAIRHPNKKQLLASIKLKSDECIMTSGGYERYYEHKGKKYAHIIDPRTGYPASQVQSITIIDKKGALADAAATALSITKEEELYNVANKLNIHAFISLNNNNQLSISKNIKDLVQVFIND